MSKTFNVPELGENVDSATVAKVLVKKGDTLEDGQSVVELETDKTVAEVPSDVAGTVQEIHVQKGDEVKVGQKLLTLNDDASAESDASDSASKSQPKATDDNDAAEENSQSESSEPQDTKAEKTDTDTATAESDDKAEPAETQTQKPSERRSSAEPESDDDTERSESAAKAQPAAEPVPAAPSVRRFAREIGVDLTEVEGSGPHGRVSIDDVKQHARDRAEQGPKGTPAPALPDISQWGEVQREPMRKVRRLTAERMAQSWSAIPHVTQFGKADVTNVEALRRQYKGDAKAAGGHLTLMVILIKTVAGALKTFPQFNASVDAGASEIVYRRYFNIGVAMDTERGLVVPVIRNVDTKNVIELSVELSDITAKARDGKLAVADMQGGGFTISNAGALGGDTFTPIINWPEVAILGMARTRTEVCWQQDAAVPRLMLPLSLSYDHRLIDGADGVRFMQWIVEALEEPVKLLWEG